MSSIWIIGDFSFPFGTAAAARIRNLSEALVEKGYTVRIVALANQGSVYSSSDFGEKITFTPDFASTTVANKNPWQKLLWFLRTYRRSLAVFRYVKSIWRDKPEAVIYYGRSYFRLKPFIHWMRSKQVPSVIDIVELNETFMGLGGICSPVYWDWKFGAVLFPRLINGAMTITTYLEKHAKKSGYRKVITIPSIERFEVNVAHSHDSESEGQSPFLLVYLGTLLPRENPEFIICLARHLAIAHGQLKLVVAGRYSDHISTTRHVESLIEMSRIGVVELLGSLSREQMADLMLRADAFLLSRASRISEIASFPTRLPEFLQTAKPIFLCPVGDISMYLDDGLDVVYLDPNNPSWSAKTILRHAQSRESLAAIGKNGFKKASRVFNRSAHATNLLVFMGLKSSTTEIQFKQ